MKPMNLVNALRHNRFLSRSSVFNFFLAVFFFFSVRDAKGISWTAVATISVGFSAASIATAFAYNRFRSERKPNSIFGLLLSNAQVALYFSFLLVISYKYIGNHHVGHNDFVGVSIESIAIRLAVIWGIYLTFLIVLCIIDFTILKRQAI